jgi:hypothetical protein
MQRGSPRRLHLPSPLIDSMACGKGQVTQATSSCSPLREHRDSIPKAQGWTREPSPDTATAVRLALRRYPRVGGGGGCHHAEEGWSV